MMAWIVGAVVLAVAGLAVIAACTVRVFLATRELAQTLQRHSRQLPPRRPTATVVAARPDAPPVEVDERQDIAVRRQRVG